MDLPHLFDIYPIYKSITQHLSNVMLVRLTRTCRSLQTTIRSRRWNINSHLSPFVANPLAFRSQLGALRAIVSGSNALAFLDGVKSYGPNCDLDIYLPDIETLVSMGDFLVLTEGYVYSKSPIKCEPDLGSDLSWINGYITATKNKKKKKKKKEEEEEEEEEEDSQQQQSTTTTTTTPPSPLDLDWDITRLILLYDNTNSNSHHRHHPNLYEDFDGILSVVTFTHPTRHTTIQLIATETSSVLDCILGFDLTLVMNYYTWNRCISLFPHLTFNQRLGVRNAYSAPAVRALRDAKYMARGFMLEDEPRCIESCGFSKLASEDVMYLRGLPEWRRQENAVALSKSWLGIEELGMVDGFCRRRALGDRHCWMLPLDVEGVKMKMEEEEEEVVVEEVVEEAVRGDATWKLAVADAGRVRYRGAKFDAKLWRRIVERMY